MVSVPVPDELDWFIWKPIVKGKVTLQELETCYTLEELQLLHMAMDVEDRLQAKAESPPDNRR